MADIIRVKAGDLDEALVDAYPRSRKKRKPTPVSLEFYEAASQLAVIEARHGKFQNLLSASGEWPHQVQVDGVALRRMVTTYPPEAELELHAEIDALLVCLGKSKVRIPRIDGPAGKPIKRKPQEPDPRHKGMPEGVDKPLRPDFPQKETWDFSAHMVLIKKDK